MQRSMSHAGGLSRNSDGRKAALLHSSREDMGAGEKAQGKGLCVMEMEAIKNLVSMNFRLSLIRIRYVKFFCRIYVFYGVELLLLCYSITI